MRAEKVFELLGVGSAGPLVEVTEPEASGLLEVQRGTPEGWELRPASASRSITASCSMKSLTSSRATRFPISPIPPDPKAIAEINNLMSGIYAIFNDTLQKAAA